MLHTSTYILVLVLFGPLMYTFYTFTASHTHVFTKKKKNNNNYKSAILLLERNHVSSIRCLKSWRKACLLFCQVMCTAAQLGCFSVLLLWKEDVKSCCTFNCFLVAYCPLRKTCIRCILSLWGNMCCLFGQQINAPSLDAARYREKNRVLIFSRTWVRKETTNHV
jgi:hypothetical protein